ncbi:hypothetical protein HOE22_12745 [Candidatus Woesearchaeota archaeon]|nr:hypothetical protein [Candidatus Woesearchaeota archaeon]
MSYLYVSGCSFTWGTELDNPPEENWGHFLGKKLGLSVINDSYAGQGNDEMFRRVYELLYITKSLPSIIVIQLSELARIRIFDDIEMKWKSASMASWDLPKKTRDYYWKYYYSIYQNMYYLFVQMLLLKDKCDSLGIEFYVFDGICDINLHCLSLIRDGDDKQILLNLYQSIKDKNFLLYNGDYSWNQIKSNEKVFKEGHELFWKDRSGHPKDGEWSLDEDHPTKESHEFMANELYNFIKELK